LTDAGRPVRRIVGIVGSEYVLGVNLFQELLAGIRDIVGGLSITIQNALADAREALLEKLKSKAARVYADAALGVTFTLSEWSSQGKSMLILLAAGAAVEFSDQDPDA
jgi:uncharacterized protein YbjQ (UPF0145 family)